MALINLHRICKIKQTLFGNKERPDESFSKLSEFKQNMRCMAETLMLIRAISEKYIEQMEDADASKFYKSWCVIERFYGANPWADGEKTDQQKLQHQQMIIRPILSEIEGFLGNLPIVNSYTNEPIQKQSKNTEPIDELADLRYKLEKSEVDNQMRRILGRLFLLKQTVFNEKAQKTEAELMQRADSLGTKLLEAQHELQAAKEDRIVLGVSKKEFESSLRSLRVHHYLYSDCFKDKSPVKTRKIASQKAVNLKNVPIKVLKQQLRNAKGSLLEAKTLVSEIKKDLCRVRCEGVKTRSRSNKRAPKKAALKTLKRSRRDIIHIVDTVIKQLHRQSKLKFPASKVMWRFLCSSLQDNLLIVRERYRSMDLGSCKNNPLMDNPSATKELPLSKLCWHQIHTKEHSPENTIISRPPMMQPAGSRHSSVSLISRSSSKISKGMPFGVRRNIVLKWCREKTSPYGLPMYEFCRSWRSGRALCALIHSYRPQLVPPKYLRQMPPKETLEYGDSVARSLGLYSPINITKECCKDKPNFEKVFLFVEQLMVCLEDLP